MLEVDNIEVRYGNTAELGALLLEEGDATPANVFLSQDAGALGALSQAGLFTTLPDDVTSAILAGFTSTDGSWVGITGRARVVASDERGREVILAVLESGDYVGEMSLIDNEPHSATVRAEVQTDVLVLGRPEFARCLPENSSLSYAILRGLVQRLRAADRQIESLALLDVYGRVARALLDMADEDAGEKVIRGKVSRQDLAKHVGASREMVSRVMKDLEERGLIETQETGSVVLKERLSNTA